MARGLPTAVTLAAEDEVSGVSIARFLARPSFRPYASTDIIGAEVGGAIKNVLAIACGVVDGRGLGLNARAALIARGFAEMTRFGLAKGARPETLAGLAGLGDLVLTCSSENSRNFSLGKGIGEGRSGAELLAGRRTVAEGAARAVRWRRRRSSSASTCRSSPQSTRCSRTRFRWTKSSNACSPGRSGPSWADQGFVNNTIAAAPTTTIAANSQTHHGGGHFIQKIVS